MLITETSTASLQHIINGAAGRKVLFFPHGTYLVSDTLLIPPGTRYVHDSNAYHNNS